MTGLLYDDAQSRELNSSLQAEEARGGIIYCRPTSGAWICTWNLFEEESETSGNELLGGRGRKGRGRGEKVHPGQEVF